MGLTIKAKDMRKFLESKGFWVARTNKHHILTNGTCSFPLSKHDKEELKTGTLSGILESAKLSKEDLEVWMGRK